MIKRKTYFRHKQDFVADEMTIALLEKATYEFNELFLVVYDRLRARDAASGGEEMLRLRVYEKLQTLVAQGLVKKAVKKYTGVRAALRARAEEVAAAATAAEERRGATLAAK